MKTLSTLTAVAALIAGMSIASAQMSPSGGSSSSSSSDAAPQAIGSSPYCIAVSPSGSLNCKYVSLAACEKDAKPQNLNCAPNPNRGTTGSRQ